MQSTVFQDNSFYLRDTYDAKVKKDLGKRKMTGNARFIPRLFPSSKVLSVRFFTWKCVYPHSNISMMNVADRDLLTQRPSRYNCGGGDKTSIQHKAKPVDRLP